ncbi:MAG: Flp family type IVb pilin [Pirellulaceae bacterium]
MGDFGDSHDEGEGVRSTEDVSFKAWLDLAHATIFVLSHPSPAMILRFQQHLARLLREEDGPTAVEYAVMLSLIVGVCVVSVRALATVTRSSFDQSAQAISGSLNP